MATSDVQVSTTTNPEQGTIPGVQSQVVRKTSLDILSAVQF